MLEYLINYGVKRHTVDYFDIDITDKLHLQDQINRVRKDYYDLMVLMDEIQDRILEVNRKISRRSKELLSSVPARSASSVLSSDDEYSALEAERDALKSGANMANNQIEMCKNDLRILNSVFYNKF